MGEYSNDMLMAVHGLKDEREGVEEYKLAIQSCSDPVLKGIFERHLEEEKDIPVFYWIGL